MGWGSWIECPPTSTPPASWTFLKPPANIFPSVSVLFVSGQQTMFIAVSTSPPIAKTSLKALAAAISPKSEASATIAGKKSNVWIMAVSASIRNTAASSDESKPTKKFGFSCFGNWLRRLPSTPGPIFALHPPQINSSFDNSCSIFLTPVGHDVFTLQLYTTRQNIRRIICIFYK